jgi:hypothetical protein
MRVDTHNLTTDVERMEDEASPPHQALFTTPRLADATKDLYRRLGASHRRRHEAAQLSARAIQERDDAQQLACHRRWPTIVDAMRTLVDCYNDGTGGETLIIVDGPTGQGKEPMVTVTARGGRALVMAVDNADLWVRTSQDENGRMQGERWIGLDRTDEATASYVLQNWMAQLDA